MKLTIAEMIKRNEAAGQNWFSLGSMQFFNTKIVAKPNVANIFITSECYGEGYDRKFSLRWFNTETNMVDTLGEFMAYETLSDAREARKVFTKSKKEFGITA